MEGGNKTEMATPVITKEKVEAIYINVIPNWMAVIQNLKKVVVSELPPLKLVGNTLKLVPKTVDDYRAVKRYLTESNVPYHALSVKDERPRKVVIRGLPAKTSVTDIVTALSDQGFTVESSFPLCDKKTKVTMPLFLTTVKPTANWESIFEITDLLHRCVAIVPYNSPKVRQCYRCQRFGHSSAVCTMPPRCVRCMEGHLSVQCTIDKTTTKPKCCNCEGDHPANYRGCTKNPKNIKKNIKS